MIALAQQPSTERERPKEPANLGFEGGADGDGIPLSWNDRELSPCTGGDGYRISVDTELAHAGKGSGKIECVGARETSPRAFGTLTQKMAPDEYRGKRLRYSGYVRTNRVTGHAGLWMRVDGPKRGVHLSFDNMSGRGLSGTRPWQSCEVVLDVPQEATAILFGALLSGTGRMWIDDLKFEVVDQSVPVTSSVAGDGPFGGKEVKIDPSLLDDYVGKFRVSAGEGGIVFEFVRDGDKLMALQRGAPKCQIYPESETTFFYKVVDAKFTFVRDDDGVVNRVVLHQFGRTFPGKRVE